MSTTSADGRCSKRREVKTGPHVQCWHGSETQPSIRCNLKTVPDSPEARTAEFWVDRLPPGVSFRLELLDDWMDATGRLLLDYQVRRSDLAPAALPPAGGGLEVVALLLPHGVVRAAVKTGHSTDGLPVYALRLRPGDSRRKEDWADLVSTTEVKRLPRREGPNGTRRLG